MIFKQKTRKCQAECVAALHKTKEWLTMRTLTKIYSKQGLAQTGLFNVCHWQIYYQHWTLLTCKYHTWLARRTVAQPSLFLFSAFQHGAHLNSSGLKHCDTLIYITPFFKTLLIAKLVAILYTKLWSYSPGMVSDICQRRHKYIIIHLCLTARAKPHAEFRRGHIISKASLIKCLPLELLTK